MPLALSLNWKPILDAIKEQTQVQRDLVDAVKALTTPPEAPKGRFLIRVSEQE